jgi:saccharopine dehydrogenase-like NADP-dependent oxidoreductase
LNVYPTATCCSYEDVYGIQGTSTIFRGTLRFRGLCNLMSMFRNIGLFSDDEADVVTWGDLITSLKEKRGDFGTAKDLQMVTL